MKGAIMGDIIGSAYEFSEMKDVNFEFFSRKSFFTDDSVMTVAVADALLSGKEGDELKEELIDRMKYWGRKYPGAGFGGTFIKWILTGNREPYGSYGNGSAMRVSPAGWLYDTLEETLEKAKLTADVTHNHPEGIKGAQSVAACIFLGRTGASKSDIREYVENTFGYDLSRTCDEIRKDYCFDVTCQGSVPESIIAFLEGESYEECVRLSVSLGGDADTTGAITGSIAEAFYGGIGDLDDKIDEYVTDKEMVSVIDRFYRELRNRI